MQDGGIATAMVIIKNLERGNIMPIVNDLNNYAKALQEIDEKHDDLTQITDQKELVELASLETTVVVLQGILARIKEIKEENN